VLLSCDTIYPEHRVVRRRCWNLVDSGGFRCGEGFAHTGALSEAREGHAGRCGFQVHGLRGWLRRLAMSSMDANDGVCVAETLLHVADAEP
jgi:hypothetical protein